MREQATEKLESVLKGTHVREAGKYLKENEESLVRGERPFGAYMKRLLREKNLRQQDVFLRADVPERYGYKLLSEEKHTRQRDVILRLCLGAELTLTETQRALKLCGMSPLYAKIPRDAVLMIAFNNGLCNVHEVDALLKEQGMEPLKESGAGETV